MITRANSGRCRQREISRKASSVSVTAFVVNHMFRITNFTNIHCPLKVRQTHAKVGVFSYELHVRVEVGTRRWLWCQWYICELSVPSRGTRRATFPNASSSGSYLHSCNASESYMEYSMGSERNLHLFHYTTLTGKNVKRFIMSSTLIACHKDY